MKKYSKSKGKKNKGSVNAELNHLYLKEILRNIENIQVTILTKLNKNSDHEDGQNVVPQTPKNETKILKNHSNRREATSKQNSRYTTPKKQKNKSILCEQKQARHFDSFLRTDLEQIQVEAFKKMNKTSNLSHIKQLNNFLSEKKESNSHRSDNIAISSFTNYCTTRQSEKKADNQDNRQRCSETQRTTIRRVKAQSKQSNRAFYSIEESLTQPKTSSTRTNTQAMICPTNHEIQSFYRSQITKMQIEEKIGQLEGQLQTCLFSKKAANLSDFQFIRTKMKKISLEINELKQKKYQLFNS